jgi:hypothetical protein
MEEVNLKTPYAGIIKIRQKNMVSVVNVKNNPKEVMIKN